MHRPLLTATLLRRAKIAESVDRTTLEKARNLLWRGRCQIEECTPTSATLVVEVDAHDRAKVRLELLDAGSIACDCNCPFFTGERPCVHIAAAAMGLEQHLQSNPLQTWETRLQSVLGVEGGAVKPKRGSRLLAFSLQPSYRNWQLVPYAIPQTALSGVSDPTDSAEVARHLRGEVGRTWRVRNPDSEQFENATQELKLAVRLAAAQLSSYNYYNTESSQLHSLLALLGDALVFTGSDGSPFQNLVQVKPESGSVALHLTSNADGSMTLGPRLMVDSEPVTVKRPEILLKDPLWLKLDGAVVGFGSVPKSLITLLESEPVIIPADEVLYFRSEYLPRAAERLPLTGEGLFGEEIRDQKPERRLYLGESAGNLQAQLRFGYGTTELPWRKESSPTVLQYNDQTGLLDRIHRDTATEIESYDALLAHGLKRGTEAGEFTLRARLTPVDFLLHHLPRLVETGFAIFGEEALSSIKVNRTKPTLSFNVSSGIDWFDVEGLVEFGETHATLKELRRAIRKKERYVKLADGSIGMIPDDWIERFRHIFALAGEPKDTDALRLSPLHALLFEQAITDSDGNSQVDAEFERKKQALRRFDKVEEVPLPASLEGILRPYQKSGYDWLHFLRTSGFGGCLADDMGTGKTAQTLALLLSLQGQNKKASLLVVPRSLVFNWEREAEKFAPGLKLLRYDDSARVEDTKTFDGHDLIITTYGILLRDIEKLSKYPFFYAILDEAQAIKNPLSQTSRAARLLKAQHKLTLTGTPIENGTAELWSQFAFLNPGLLGGLEIFKENFLGPIERGKDENAVTALRSLTRPFLLRRTKAQVASDLPPRTERIITVELEKAQRTLYEQTRDKYRAQILGIMDNEGNSNAQLRVLEGLLRLRQVCCDPRLMDPTTKVGSAKLEAVLETMETLRSEGHKALIFSQFTQMLGLLKAELDARKIPYLYLDGRTKDRQKCVDTFQSDEAIPFFLISLKAGGVGLNLTAADYVIHIDPWWNPAVEQQASDRTHRIGQTRPVFVYKFLARDTVEEKIVMLQERKKALVDSLIQTDQSLFKSLTRDDIAALFS
ncbi:SNF2-related protein [Armatimonas sp.]|uniref:DEAD/DEAH box helicase n=1 Tax=Armatimonas sp. TaxID=1872638 RepID=UPI0037504A3D